ncbi:MAG: hypothetical protein WKF71_19725 [Pyrinomonadaceae bacterium]
MCVSVKLWSIRFEKRCLREGVATVWTNGANCAAVCPTGTSSKRGLPPVETGRSKIWILHDRNDRINQSCIKEIIKFISGEEKGFVFEITDMESDRQA